LSSADRNPDRHAAPAGAWIKGVVVALEARRFRGRLAAFRKPVVPDRLIGLADLRHVAVMREDDVGRRPKRELDTVLWHRTEFRHTCRAHIFDAIVVRAGCDADWRLCYFVVDLTVGAGHEPLPLARNVLRVLVRHMLT